VLGLTVGRIVSTSESPAPIPGCLIGGMLSSCAPIVVALFFILRGGGVVVVAVLIFFILALLARLYDAKANKPFVELFVLCGAALTPHALFLATFNALAEEGIEPSTLSAVLRYYEEAVLWLHCYAIPEFTIPFYGGLALSVAFMLLAALKWVVWPMKIFSGYLKVTSRVGTFLLVATSFTVFTGIPVGKWSTDLNQRLTLQLRDTNKSLIEKYLALQIFEQLQSGNVAGQTEQFWRNTELMSDIASATYAHPEIRARAVREIARAFESKITDDPGVPQDLNTYAAYTSDTYDELQDIPTVRIVSSPASWAARYDSLVTSSREDQASRDVVKEAIGKGSELLARCVVQTPFVKWGALAGVISEDFLSGVIERGAHSLLKKMSATGKGEPDSAAIARATRPLARLTVQSLFQVEMVQAIDESILHAVTDDIVSRENAERQKEQQVHEEKIKEQERERIKAIPE
jgi:hypothetical protein